MKARSPSLLAEAGYPLAQTNLGVLLYERGEADEAEAWLRRAAEAGNSDAQHNLDLLLTDRAG